MFKTRRIFELVVRWSRMQVDERRQLRLVDWVEEQEECMSVGRRLAEV